MKKLRPFELALVSIFGLLAVGALMLLSLYKPDQKVAEVTLGSSVIIWGTVSGTAFSAMLEPIKDENPAFNVVRYYEKDERTFDTDLINALAEGKGPDIIFIPHENLVQYRTKILSFSYDNFPLRDFKDRYIDGAEIFALSDGIYSYPVAIDPLVMYYNRDLLSTKNIINPPATWEVLVNEVVPTVVERDYARNIIRSPLAFGEYRNVRNSFAVLSMLLLQGGSSFVTETGGSYAINLNQSIIGSGLPLENALTFYTNFASPSNPLYSWNRAQGLDRDEFLAEDLALYFGKGSEAYSLASQNPNLNFDIAEVPQGAGATVRRTYASFYGFSVLKSSKNVNGALAALQVLASPEQSFAFSQALNMAPAYRSTLLSGSDDKYGRISFAAAKVARGWLSPNPDLAEPIITQMVEDVLANRRRPSDSANDMEGRLSGAY